jgi:hypothetical protein
MRSRRSANIIFAAVSFRSQMVKLGHSCASSLSEQQQLL